MAKAKFDDTNPKSIEDFGKKLVGKTFAEVIRDADGFVSKETIAAYANKNRKGGLGNLLEELHFGYEINSNPDADFSKAGVELKVTPYEITKGGALRAGERLVLCMISYENPVDKDFYSSHLWQKSHLLLLVYYHRNKSLGSNLKYRISYVTLFTPPKKDLEIIIDDYKHIIGKIVAGKANELSEADTMYLGACTKGSTAEKSTVPQFYFPHTLARKRAFCYKNSYMTSVLNEYVVPGKETYEPIIKNPDELKETTFEQYIQDRINQYVGMTDIELCAKFGREYNKNKQQWFDLAHRMLGISSNKAEEFVKANIVVKAMRMTESGTPKESSPLPPFAFKELAATKWEDSSVYNYFSETKFCYVVFQIEGDHCVLKGCQLWNMPLKDLEGPVHSCWKETVKVIKQGIQWIRSSNSRGVVIQNNLPGISDNPIVHVRPHTSKRYYRYLNGETIGNGSPSDSDELPDGRLMPKQSFWLNSSYILSQLRDDLK